MRIIPITLIGVALTLASCAPTPEQLEAKRQAELRQDHDTCISHGFRRNSDNFRNCMLQLDIAREQREYYYYNRPYDTGPRFSYGFYHFHHR